MEFEKIIQDKLSKQLGHQELVKLVSIHISELINKNFMQFVQLMYRLDIDEKHFYESEILDTDHLAEIIIQHEIRKIEFKKNYKNNSNKIEDEDAW